MAGMRQRHGEYSRLSHSPSLRSSTSIGGKKRLDAFPESKCEHFSWYETYSWFEVVKLDWSVLSFYLYKYIVIIIIDML